MTLGTHRCSRRTLAVGAAAIFGAVSAVSGPAATPAFAASPMLYVGGANCSDSGAGAQDRPYCTIAKAATVAAAGQTVVVANGTYAERVVVANSGAATAPVVFTAAPGATVTVNGKENGFVVAGKSFVTIRGFHVTATTSYGIYLSNAHNILVADNSVTGAGQPRSGATAVGIELSAVTNSTVTGNRSNHNSDHGIYLNPASSGNLITDNESSWNAESYRRNANGIDVTGAANTVIGNVLHDNEDSGLQFYTGGNNNLAALNVSYNNGDHGIDDLNVTGGRLIGNTIYHNCTSGINVEGTSGDYTVENNIAVDNAVYPAYNGIACDRRAGNIGIWDSAPASTTVDNNLVYLSKPGTMYVFGPSYTSLTAMRAATGQELHGKQAVPQFVNAGAGDLRLTEGSPAIDAGNAGVSGEQAADLLGTARIDDPLVANTGRGPRDYDDLGAYEFVSTGVPAGPIARLAVSPTSGTAPLAITADASGSTDPQGEPLTYAFDFGDDTAAGPQSTPVAAHTFATAGSYTITLTVTDTAGIADTALATVTVSSAVGSATYVGQIATNYSTSSHTSGNIVVWRPQGVAVGDTEIITVALTGTVTTGSFSGVDDAGNALVVAEDVSDGRGNRLAVLYGAVQHALITNDRITVSFPGAAATYRITGDEVSGVTGVDRAVSATGSSSTYSSGSTGTTSSASELIFGAVAIIGGPVPTWAGGWTAETGYVAGANAMGRAYRIATAVGSFTASGTTSGSWLAACVTLR